MAGRGSTGASGQMSSTTPKWIRCDFDSRRNHRIHFNKLLKTQAQAVPKGDSGQMSARKMRNFENLNGSKIYRDFHRGTETWRLRVSVPELLVNFFFWSFWDQCVRAHYILLRLLKLLFEQSCFCDRVCVREGGEERSGIRL